ncbi:MAG: hypothetical protein MUE70_12695, partial [Desulfobacterales bacterium]|nr:hypothetical protein [Desulfobacterales bacterium]
MVCFISQATAANPNPTVKMESPASTVNPQWLDQYQLLPLAVYPDPGADIEWPYSSENSAADVQTRFNAARTAENAQLGTSIPMMALPSQSTWNSLGDGEKALWLINRERIDRGILPFEGLEPNVTSVAQYYAQYLLDHNVFSHTADGRSPSQRLSANPNIGSCWEWVGENLAAFMGGWNLPIERSVYNWMYDDSGSSWGHRHIMLTSPLNNNSGSLGNEGFLGIGIASGTFQGWPNSDIVVMDAFDPCALWEDGEESGSLQFSLSTYNVNENGGTATITVTRTGGSSGA